MNSYSAYITTLLKQLFILIILFEICRWLFFLFNYSIFNTLSIIELCKISVIGLRFDISAIIAFNSLYIMLYLLPFSFTLTWGYKSMLKVVFFAVNSTLLLSNCIDFEYFKFILKRSSVDLISLASTGNDFFNIAPKMASDFWPALASWILLCLIMIGFYNKTLISTEAPEDPEKSHPIGLARKASVFILVCPLVVTCIIDALQLRPISVMSAGSYVSSEHIPLVINTPFSILKSIGNVKLKEVSYFSNHELATIYNAVHAPINDPTTFRKFNVVVIIMESFSKEYIGSLNSNNGYTPFLDSLINESMVFDHAFANGKKSIEGIPAVVASIPQLMTTPYILSSYSKNRINSLASILRNKGYYTAFYHGGNNGTMGFDFFSHNAGFENYYGREEYGNGEYDGQWGIFDEAFFQYFSKNLSNTQQPFMACIFSLSSHHPYAIPEKFAKKFKAGSLPIHESIQYADYSLKTFFETASQTTWFDSTLFIITADHTSLAEQSYYSNKVGRYEIPIIFYMHNSELKGANHTVMQQTDILPSVLDFIDYNGNYIAYGQSVFDTTAQHCAVSFLNDVYQIISGCYILEFDGEKSISLYNYENDQNMENNLVTKELEVTKQLELQLKGIIQDYNDRLIHNNMTIE